MKIFLAGATGALGRRLVPLLVANGYQVVAMTRSAEKTEALRSAGVEPVVADGLDREAVLRAVVLAEPEVVIHQMTSLTGVTNFKKFDQEFASTNRLRTAGTDILLDAARAAGARRFIVQSYGGWNYERTGGPAKTEEDPLDPHPPAAMARTLEAIRCLSEAAPPHTGLARPTRRRRAGRLDVHPDPRRGERESEARARMAAALPELAGGLPPRPLTSSIARV